MKQGRVAQLVERLTVNQVRVGSNPTSPSSIIVTIHCSVAQRVERRVEDPRVGGSNPSRATAPPSSCSQVGRHRTANPTATGFDSRREVWPIGPIGDRGRVAQLVERLPSKQDVAGSSPVSPSVGT